MADHETVSGPSGPALVGGATPADRAARIAALRAMWASDVSRRQVIVGLRDDARVALGWNDDYLAIETPTQLQVVQQVERLTRECSGVIRLFGSLIAELVDLLDD